MNHTRFGENSVVLHTLSREYGRRSFLVRTGRKAGMAMFLPLNIVEATVSENPKATLWTATGFNTLYPLNGIRSNVGKNSMTLFISEVLYRVIKDGANEEGLFDWCEREILTLDALESDWSNFHILFLLGLAVALGFSPTFPDVAPFVREHADKLREIMAKEPAEGLLVPLSGPARNSLLESLLKYLEHHTESAINVRSLAVLRELYG